MQQNILETLTAEQKEAIGQVISDAIGNLAFNSYVTLGAKFIYTSETGKFHYAREKHILAFNQMENDFESQGLDAPPPSPHRNRRGTRNRRTRVNCLGRSTKPGEFLLMKKIFPPRFGNIFGLFHNHKD